MQVLLVVVVMECGSLYLLVKVLVEEVVCCGSVVCDVVEFGFVMGVGMYCFIDGVLYCLGVCCFVVEIVGEFMFVELNQFVVVVVGLVYLGNSYGWLVCFDFVDVLCVDVVEMVVVFCVQGVWVILLSGD